MDGGAQWDLDVSVGRQRKHSVYVKELGARTSAKRPARRDDEEVEYDGYHVLEYGSILWVSTSYRPEARVVVEETSTCRGVPYMAIPTSAPLV